MEGLDNLLNRFKRSLGRDVETREIVARCVKDATGLDIRLEDISVKNDTLRIKTSPTKRNSIKLEEAKVLSQARLETKINFKKIVY
ncbi:hypothetical protein KW800_00940 [Candidatus Parcubacteria bacterium]|nr:hypothetical protein [Candidatus Parcubacteria bacterium]